VEMLFDPEEREHAARNRLTVADQLAMADLLGWGDIGGRDVELMVLDLYCEETPWGTSVAPGDHLQLSLVSRRFPFLASVATVPIMRVRSIGIRSHRQSRGKGHASSTVVCADRHS
jgi:hypothetical protein